MSIRTILRFVYSPNQGFEETVEIFRDFIGISLNPEIFKVRKAFGFSLGEMGYDAAYLLNTFGWEIVIHSAGTIGKSKDKEQQYADLFKFLEKGIEKTSPTYASAEYDVRLDEPYFEYYLDEFYFATVLSTNLDINLDFSSRLMVLHSKLANHETGECRRLLTQAELNRIIKKSGVELFKPNQGLGLWKYRPSFSFNADRNQRLREGLLVLYPAFWIRKEVRARGGNLYFGPVEKWLANRLTSSMILSPLVSAGVISQETADKLAKARKEYFNSHPEIKNEVDYPFIPEKEFLQKILSKEEIHELGLDLPKPPSHLLGNKLDSIESLA